MNWEKIAMVFSKNFADEHIGVTRRFFLGFGAAGIAGLNTSKLWSQDKIPSTVLDEAKAKMEYLTRDEDFKSYGRGDPPPCQLPPEKRRAVGLERETWRLEILADPDSDSVVEHPLSLESGTALDWPGLMKLAEKSAIRFLRVMSCTNGKSPCGMGLWEGVPLRELIWLAKPTKNVRRIFYYGYHNEDIKQRFQSSLSIERVLEEPPGELPVTLCYKLNGEWLSPVRGGPVRMLVPGAYGNKSVKWLQRILLTNNYQANDTYALWNNDTESHLKTWACFIHAPEKAKAGQPILLTGVAQVGMSGLAKVQYFLHEQEKPLPDDDPYFAQADWKDAEILPPPDRWGGEMQDKKLPAPTLKIDDATGKPSQWPMRDALVHWAELLTNVPSGHYDLRCRTIDANGVAQPMPRPFLKSGYNAIQRIDLVVEA